MMTLTEQSIAPRLDQGGRRVGLRVSKAGLAVGTALALVLLAGQAAKAQSDETDVDRLQLQIDRLEAEVEGLRNEVDNEPEIDDEPVDAEQAPLELYSGEEAVRLSLSGQVNRGVLVVDDGEDTDVFHVDNDNASTRIRLLGDARLNEDITAGTVFEVQFESNSTADVSQDNERNVGDNNFTERKLELFFDSETLGRLTLGQGDTASNSTSEVDLSGVGVVGYSGVADFAGGIQFRDDDGDLSGVTIGDTFSNFDGLSRDDRVRYDTPEFAGAQLSASAIADDRYDVALRYSRELFAGTEFEAAVAYADVDDDFDQINGSASVLLAGGLNATVAAGTADFEEGGRDDGVFYYGKVGYLLSPFTLGDTGIALDYYYGEDIAEDGDESETIGLLAVQNVDAIGTELYGGARNYQLDRGGEDFDDVNALLVGARVKF